MRASTSAGCHTASLNPRTSIRTCTLTGSATIHFAISTMVTALVEVLVVVVLILPVSWIHSKLSIILSVIVKAKTKAAQNPWHRGERIAWPKHRGSKLSWLCAPFLRQTNQRYRHRHRIWNRHRHRHRLHFTSINHCTLFSTNCAWFYKNVRLIQIQPCWKNVRILLLVVQGLSKNMQEIGEALKCVWKEN